MPFGQVVIGPPGSGKTTYCNGMQQFLNALGRKNIVVNLDPANDVIPYECSINIQDLVALETVMEKFKLGPNGGIVYCLDYLEKNIDWLQTQLEKYKDCYVLFDFPGQIELFTVHNSVKKITEKLQKWNYRLTAVHLVDSHYCSDPFKFISVLLVSLSSMVKLELPHINVLSKVDLIQQYGELDYDIDYYADVQNLKYLIQTMELNNQDKRFTKLNAAIAEVVEDYSLVSFTTLDIQDKKSVYNVLKLVDKSNGYVFGALEQDNRGIFGVAATELDWQYNRFDDVRSKYLDKDSTNDDEEVDQQSTKK